MFGLTTPDPVPVVAMFKTSNLQIRSWNGREGGARPCPVRSLRSMTEDAPLPDAFTGAVNEL
jgi:hypothetical protein